MNAEDVRSCVTCAHFEKVRDVIFRCRAPELDTKIDLVTGERVPRMCGTMRGNDHYCGEIGRFWKSAVDEEVDSFDDEPPSLRRRLVGWFRRQPEADDS